MKGKASYKLGNDSQYTHQKWAYIWNLKALSQFNIKKTDTPIFTIGKRFEKKLYRRRCSNDQQAHQQALHHQENAS